MSGGYNKKIYDTCAFQQRVADSVSECDYSMYRGKYVNGNRCHVPQCVYLNLVDVESELKNQTRLSSSCNMFKYHPSCKFDQKGNNTCISTFSKLNPIVLPPQVCPDAERLLYFNSGLKKPQNPGFVTPSLNVCNKAPVKPCAIDVYSQVVYK